MTETAAFPSGDPARPLGRIPSGIFILTSRNGDFRTGMLASWVQQAGFEPPMVSVAIRRDRFLVDWLAENGRFTLNQVAAGDKALLRHFARGFEPGQEAFEGLDVRETEGGIVLADALTYLSAEVAGAIDGGDHRVILGRVLDGAILATDSEPMVHLRKTGLHY